MHCLRLLEHCADMALSRARFSAGSSMPARIAMIAITIRSSISEKQRNDGFPGDFFPGNLFL